MPERPKYERVGDQEEGIRLNDMPQHAYLDGDEVVAQPPTQKDTSTTPLTEAAAPAPVRMPAAPYPVTDDGYHTPPAALLPGSRPPGRIASPVRPDYQSTPHQQPYVDAYRDEYSGNAGDHSNQSYNNAYHGGGGYRDEQDPYYYENSGGGYGRGRSGGFVV